MPERGDIVLVAFPFTDTSGEKRRPALVIGISDEHAVLVFITSRTTGNRKWHVSIMATKQTGLTIKSTIRCDKMTSLDIRVISGKLGEVPSRVMQTVDSKLRKLLQL